jgi:hypothetical protein
VVDPEEAKSMQKMRGQLQALRVDMLRAGMRLGYAATSEQLQQWLGVLERVEKVNAPPLRRRVDVNRLALAEATVSGGEGGGVGWGQGSEGGGGCEKAGQHP